MECQALLRKQLLGCRAGAATESRPYRAFHCCGRRQLRHYGLQTSSVMRTAGQRLVGAEGPGPLDYSEQEGSAQTKQNPTVQRLQRAHELPGRWQAATLVSVTRHRIQRIEHRGLAVGQGAKNVIGRCPHSTLNSVQASYEQRCWTYKQGQEPDGKTTRGGPLQEALDRLIYQPEAIDVNHHCHYNQGQTPGPVDSPRHVLNRIH